MKNWMLSLVKEQNYMLLRLIKNFPTDLRQKKYEMNYGRMNYLMMPGF